MTNDNGNCLIDGCTNCTSCFEIHKEILIWVILWWVFIVWLWCWDILFGVEPIFLIDIFLLMCLRLVSKFLILFLFNLFLIREFKQEISKYSTVKTLKGNFPLYFPDPHFSFLASWAYFWSDSQLEYSWWYLWSLSFLDTLDVASLGSNIYIPTLSLLGYESSMELVNLEIL